MKPTLPVFGQPVFVIEENILTDKVQLAVEGSYFNNLTYFAVSGIFVKKLEYDERFPGDLSKIIINKGMKSENDPTKSLELTMDLSLDIKEQTATTTFSVEAEAQAIAKKLNENQKRICKKLLDAASKAFNSYDEIIAVCKV